MSCQLNIDQFQRIYVIVDDKTCTPSRLIALGSTCDVVRLSRKLPVESSPLGKGNLTMKTAPWELCYGSQRNRSAMQFD